MTEFSERVIKIIQDIPPGKVLTYGSIAAAAGNPGGARLVTRLIHSCTKKYNLPWHRVINSNGQISLKGEGALKQQSLLEAEGIEFQNGKTIDLSRYLWKMGC